MTHAPAHVCGALPQTHLSINVVRCEVHQAFTARVHMYQEDGEHVTDLLPMTEMEFGPFDAWADIVAWVEQRMAADVLLER